MVRHAKQPSNVLDLRQPTKKTRGWRPSKKQLLFGAWFVLTILVGILIWWRISNRPFFPATIKASYPLYYPTKVPKDFTLDKSKFLSTKDSVIYSFKSKSGQVITISQQAKPGNFDLAKFGAQNLTAPTQFLTPFGTVAVGKFQNGAAAVVLTSQTLVFINAPKGNIEQVSQVAGHLKLR